MTYILLVILNISLSLIQFLVAVECVCSWIPDVVHTSFYNSLYRFNGTFLNPIRKLQRKFFDIPVDFSPIILFVIIGIIRGYI